MKKSLRWLGENANQRINSKLAELPVVGRTGPNAKTSTPSREQNEHGEPLFVVGFSEVGGDEVAG